MRQSFSTVLLVNERLRKNADSLYRKAPQLVPFCIHSNHLTFRGGSIHFGVTYSPRDAWIAQQLREATPFGEGPRFLIRDNDGKDSEGFARVAAASGIEVIRTPLAAPKANAVCEWFMGSVRRALLDQILILNERQLRCKVVA